MRLLLISAVFILVSGCGYATRGYSYKEKAIIIDHIANKINITSEKRSYGNYVTYPILIENRLTNEVINRFNTDGYLKVVSEGPGALKLTCVINDYNKEALRYTGANNDEVEEQRLRLYVDLKLTDSENKVIKTKSIVGEASYFLSGTYQRSETAAQEDLIDDTARRIVEAVTEEW